MDRALKILDPCRQLLRTLGAQRKGDRQRVEPWIERKMIAVMIDRLLRRKPKALMAA